MTSKQQIGLGQATSVKLPPISGSGFQQSTQTSLTGTSSMVAQSQANAQQLIYRSIPPNYEADFAFTSDMLGSGLPPRPGGMKGKPGPFSGNTTASEFAKRFKAKPTTQPRVIEFNARTVNSESKRRGVNGFFPPVKLRGSAKTAPPQDSEISSRMQLMPTSYSEVRPRSSRSVSSSRKSNNSQRQTPDSVRTAPHATDNYSMYPNVFQETFDCDDLSLLPPPKRILPKRDLPWVFRYKVKKNMNELAKIMASKPQQMVDV